MRKMKNLVFAIVVLITAFTGCEKDDEIIEVNKLIHIDKPTAASLGLKGNVKTVEIKKYDSTLQADSKLHSNKVSLKEIYYFDKDGVQLGVETFKLLDATTETFRTNDS